MAFRFRYHGVRYAAALAGNEGRVTLILGVLESGTIHSGDSIFIPTQDGQGFASRVAQFYDSLYECTGMPFHHEVRANPEFPFALVLRGQPANNDINCPG